MVPDKLSKDELQKAYDEWHKSSGDAKLNGEGKFHRRFIKLLEPKPGSRILDVGCGKGVFLRLAEQRGLITAGIDIWGEAINIASRLAPKSELKVGVAEELPWEDNYFDYVTCLGSMEHFLDPEKAIIEMVRVLKPDGKCCLLVPNTYFIGLIYMAARYGTAPDHGQQVFSERFGTRAEWQELIERNGLKVLKVYKSNAHLSSRKVKSVTQFIYNILIRPFLPLNLSDCFIFICRKESEKQH